MKIAAWNLNHRTFLKPIPSTVANVLRELSTDVVVLTEYVDDHDDADRVALKRALCDMGLSHISVSERRSGHNQVLLASRLRHTPGCVSAPKESHAETNFLPASFPELDMTVVGMRAPAYKTSALINSYWENLTENLEVASLKKLILIGDLNADPDCARSTGGRYLRDLRTQGWKIPAAAGAWSFISSDGRRQSRVDHLLASPVIGPVTAAYRTEVAGMVVAGPKKQSPLSDHVVLLCEVPATFEA